MTDVTGTFSRAVSLFLAGKSDNEKLASLLIIAKLLKEQETDQLTRRKIFERIGFDFINRLLITESPDSEALSSVAVAILSSYCSDPELALHPQITSKLPYFNKFISSKASPVGVVSDSLYCIEVFVSVDKGRQYLWKYRTLLSLIQCFINYESYREASKRIIISLLADFDQVKTNTDLMLESIQYLTNEIKLTQCELKFELCQLLHDINQWIGEYLTHNKWLVDIGSALSDILHSRLDVAHRHIGLMLLCSLCQTHGCHWLLEVPPKEGKSESSFLLLAVHLVSIEINILHETDSISLQNSPTSSPVPPLSLLILCFSFIEQTILLVAECSEEEEEEEEGQKRGERERNLPSEEDLLQLHSALLECMANIVKLLQRITKGFFENDETCTTEENPLLMPAIRVFGAWLAEDSLSLMSEVSLLIPNLIQYCDHDKGGGIDFIKFLVPGFLNLIQNNVLSIDEKLIGILLTYTTSLSTRLDDATIQSQLQICASLMISVCEKEEEKKEELTGTSWAEWLRILSQLIKNTFVKDFITQLIVLYLFILKLTTKQGLFIDDIKSYINIIIKLSCNYLTTEANSSCSIMSEHITKKERRMSSSDTKGRTDLVESASSLNTDCHMLQLGLKQLSVLISVNHEMRSVVTSSPSLPSLQQLYNNLSEARENGKWQLDEDIDQFLSSVNILIRNCK